ncbi:ABC transporter substrate-binding protein [Microbacterium sp. XT11]|uniref:ABC transporter substrate-binding protein n=1 Tax=Microbacterium sp. XT11 TaxID=367477 RepID=UPI000AEA699D|nr:ABC transporter substrate-binding protein [Microbacterium sp. XT11]
MRTQVPRIAAIAGLTIAAVMLSACSTGPTDDTTGSEDGVTSITGGADAKTAFDVAVDDDLAARAAEIVADGTLDIATKAGAPPYEFFEDGDVLRGSDIDLGRAIAAKLGLDAEFSSMEFAGILPAIEAKRYDMSIAGRGDTPARQEVVDFVDYSTDSNSIVTTKGNPHDIKGIDTLCGLSVSSVEGSVYLGLLEEQNKSCADPIDITVFQDNANALLQVQTGRADATMYQTGVALYLIKTDEASAGLEVVDSEEYGKGYNAIAFNKDNAELRDLVQEALVALDEDGIYEDIHVAWGLTANTIDEFTINDGLRFNQPS